jgi:hypothetical protein
MKTHKIGATLDWAGPVQIGRDFPDLSAWSAAATLRGRGFKHDLAAALIHTGGKTILRLTAAPAAQARWKSGEAALDVKFIRPDGVTLITPAALLTLEHAITGA